MRLGGAILLGLMVLTWTGCGTTSGPGSLVVGDATGVVDVLLNGQIDTAIDVNVDANVVGDVTCTVLCDLNTGNCDTVCEFDAGIPPTPVELGQELYLANCSACHGDPVGTGFAPDLTGKTATKILDQFNSGSHPGGQFPSLTQEDVDNLAAFLGV